MHSRRGFTLVEVVIAIIGLLVALLNPCGSNRSRSHTAHCVHESFYT